MRDLNEYASECMAELEDLGIEIGNVLEFKVNTRALHRWGQCRGIPGGYSINISAVLLDERNDEQGLINTIFHELLHTCKGYCNHGKEWKRLADKINKAYGYNIKRTSSSDDKGLSEESKEEQKIKSKEKLESRKKYEIICQNCGHKYTRYRASKATQHPEKYRCGKCQGELKVFIEY